MPFILENWGNAYGNMNSEVQELRRQYLQFCDDCPKAHDFTCSGANAAACEVRKQELLKKLWDISDTRLFCVVVNRDKVVPCLRHIFRVSEQALNHLEELKAEYYQMYSQLPDDCFCFFRGLHRAQEYGERFGKE